MAEDEVQHSTLLDLVIGRVVTGKDFGGQETDDTHRDDEAGLWGKDGLLVPTS